MEEEAPGRRARVDGIGDIHEVHTVSFKTTYKIDELLDALAQSIELPDDHRIAAFELVERLEEPRPFADPPADRVLETFSHPIRISASRCRSSR